MLLNTRTCVQMPSSENEKKAKSRFEEEEKKPYRFLYIFSNFAALKNLRIIDTASVLNKPSIFLIMRTVSKPGGTTLVFFNSFYKRTMLPHSEPLNSVTDERLPN